MEHYKSWAGLREQLTRLLCDEFKHRISYFLTYYHNVHNSYGRAAILLDKKELVCFSWIETFHQENDISSFDKAKQGISYQDMLVKLKPTWDADCTYCNMDFLDAALQFRSLPIQCALESENYIIKILAIMDRRVGKRTLSRIAEAKEYEKYPAWVRQFYTLRLS